MLCRWELILQTLNKISFAFIGVFMLLCYLITFFAYFKVYRIIRQRQQQIHENQSQGFEQSTINLAKYKRSLKSVLYILTFFSLTFFPVFAVDERVHFLLGSVWSVSYCSYHLFLIAISKSCSLCVEDEWHSESSQAFILLECRVNTSLDHHLVNMTKGLFRDRW